MGWGRGLLASVITGTTTVKQGMGASFSVLSVVYSLSPLQMNELSPRTGNTICFTLTKRLYARIFYLPESGLVTLKDASVISKWQVALIQVPTQHAVVDTVKW